MHHLFVFLLSSFLPLKCNVVVNHHVELSEEEKKAAREAAIKKLQEDVYKRQRKGYAADF